MDVAGKEPRDRTAARTGALTAALVLLAAVLMSRAQAAPVGWPGQPRLAWWQLALLFALAELLVFHVELRDEAHSFTLSEVPLLLGLLYAGPGALVGARLVGAACALVLFERQRPSKLAFNLALFSAETTLAVVTFQGLSVLLPRGWQQPGGEPGPWLAGWAALGAASLLGALAVRLVIRWHGGPVETRAALATAAITTACNASMATVAAVLLRHAAWALVPLAVVALVVVLAYRGYGRLTRRYAALDLLYKFTRLTGDAVRPHEATERVLDQCRALLRAELAWMVPLSPAGREGVPAAGWEGLWAGSDGSRSLLNRQLPPLLRERLLSGPDTVVLPRRCRDPQLRSCLAELGLRDLLAAPLITGAGEPAGAVLVANRFGHVSSFDAEDARLFTALAAQAGIALENARLVERLHDQVQAREYEALHDALTGLPNRVLFTNSLRTLLDRPDGSRCAVLLMDLDQFKEVNDTLGHQTGDRLLQVVADRLRVTVGERGLVARLGGDEFAILVDEPSDSGDALHLAGEVYTAVTQPIPMPPVLLAVGASIGVAMQPEHGQDPNTLLQRADVAMYAAKRTQDRVARYDPGSDWNSELRLRLAGEIRGALQAREFDVYYQPIVRTSDGQVEMVEALARWPHPELGELSPDEFIPIAERTGVIEELTQYVLDHALRQCARWRGAGLDLRVAVNLSIQAMLDAQWPDRVLELLGRHAVPADRLTLEITESTIMSDPGRTIPVISRLAEAGVLIAVDDFGTGYSSLSHLQRLPVQLLKIDKSFVLPMATDPTRLSIVRSVVELAHSLDLSTVAEGVEDQQTLDRLVDVGCDLAQGHWVSHPLPASELTARLFADLRAAALQPPAPIRLEEPVPSAR